MRTRVLVVLGAWLGLLALSRALGRPAPRPEPGRGPGRVAVEIEAQGDDGPLAGERAQLSLIHWPAPAGAPALPPVVCLHGSPGSARNFDRLGPRLAEAGRDVWALDLPGFGRSRGAPGSYSIRAHARALLAVMDRLGIERAHLLAWSMGGGVAIEAAGLAPRRVASLSLIASIGVQSAEGSGSFAFEHVKYAVVCAFAWGMDALVPHFGALADARAEGLAFARNFWQSDQRPLRAILARCEVPTLILHGREDVLVPLRAAEITHRLVEPSRLVVLDANHFLPILQVDEVLGEELPFLARHDRPGVGEAHDTIDRAPLRGWRRLEPGVMALGQGVPWWLQVLVLAAACAIAPFRAAVVGGALVAALQLDFGVVAIALALGALAGVARGRDRRLRRWIARPFAAFGWLLATLAVAMLLSTFVGESLPRSTAPLLALVALLGAAALWRRLRPRPSLAGRETVG